MSSSALTIRPPEATAEAREFFRLAAATFVRDADVEIAASDWRRFVENAPGHDPSQVRAAYRGATYVGGYLIEERRLCIGSAWLRAGCIGAVVTHPEHRRQGIATALMRDALAYARERGHALLVLNGRTGFYDPFGFVDVFDRTEHHVDRALVLAEPPGPYRVRPATPADAPAMLDLYRRHYGAYAGSFARSLEQQGYLLRFVQSIDRGAYRLREGVSFAEPALAVAPDGQPRGYYVAPWGPLRAFGSEVAADDWPAALALLQHHARLLDAPPEAPQELSWPLPPDAPALLHLADHLPTRSVTDHLPHGGWMARPIDLDGLVRTLLPLWNERLRERPAAWSGPLALGVGERSWALDVDADGLHLVSHAGAQTSSVSLSPQVFTQLLFGFRPVSWAAGQPGQQIPPDLAPLLTCIFPSIPAFIAPTDGC